MNPAKETTPHLEPPGRSSNGRPPESPPSGFNPADVYYALFRHKWIILAGCILGFAAASYLYFTRAAIYRSDARLLVRYVRESKSMDATATSGQVLSPDSRGANILNTEVEILTSFDLASEVAELVGPEKILLGTPDGASRSEAAVAIQKGLLVEIPRQSNAIRLGFRHPDPQTAQAVIRQIIISYRRKHAEVHRAIGVADEFLTKQTDELRSRLLQTEEELRTAKARAGVILVEDAKKDILAQRSRIQQELIAAEAELAERRTVLDQSRSTATSDTAAAAAAVTNEIAAATTNLAPTLAEAPLDPEILSRYRGASTRLESFRTRELDLLSQFGDDNTLLKDVRARIAEMQKVKEDLEQSHPRLLALPAPVSPLARPDSAARSPALELAALASNVSALEARVRYLNTQLDKVKAEADALNANESRINELERKRALEEANYRYFAANLEQARVDQALGAGNLPNISVVQEASPAYREARQTLKLVAQALFGCIAAGFGLAFLLEFFLDRSIRKPAQVISQLRVPLFLTVPAVRNGKSRKHRAKIPSPPPAPAPALPPPSDLSPDTAPQPVVPSAEPLALSVDPLALYHEALRDRLVMYFEINGLTHRPKLVGVTGSTPGAGTTTLAAGLAASLSETGDGNVLLVDMNLRNGAGVHPFYRGKALCGITEALEEDTRSHARVQDNLYVVTAQHGNGHKVGLVPRKFANIVPRLQAADYDYIIFDLPPVSQTSVTSKLAGLLDMTLLVLESERTKQDSAKHALGLLAESKARVAAVLNKHKPYVPRSLQTES